jgi:hypothetical protein
MIRWFLSLCLLASTAIAAAPFSSQFPLRDRLEKATSGDFIVFEANKTITLLAIRSISEHSMILEEISAPAMKKKPNSWAEWIQAKAPGHTSWSMIEIDLQNKQVLECYSFSRSAWLSQSPQDSFLATLLHLPVTPIAPHNLRRIGSPPPDGVDHRQIWKPPLFINGEQIENATFQAFEAVWPQDNSELAGKTVSLYFDREVKSPLPCWIQVDTGNITASLRAIDSGHKLPLSPYRSMPRRVPEFLSAPVKSKNGLRFSIKSPKYYKSFELFAVDVTSREKQIHLVTHSIVPGEGETLTLQVALEELAQVLQPNHKYTWLIVPTGHNSSYTEFQKPFTWIP